MSESERRAWLWVMLLTLELKTTLTSSVHAALPNTREHRGFCSARRHSPICTYRTGLMSLALGDAQAAWAEPERLEQLPFAATTTARSGGE